jgi:hypothetical protein
VEQAAEEEKDISHREKCQAALCPQPSWLISRWEDKSSMHVFGSKAWGNWVCGSFTRLPQSFSRLWLPLMIQ